MHTGTTLQAHVLDTGSTIPCHSTTSTRLSIFVSYRVCSQRLTNRTMTATVSTMFDQMRASDIKLTQRLLASTANWTVAGGVYLR